MYSYGANLVTTIFKLSDSITTLNNAFDNCTNLTTIKSTFRIPQNCMSCFQTFMNCTGLVDISTGSFIFPDSTENLGEMFSDCINLTTLNSATFKLSDYISNCGQMFYGDTKLNSDISNIWPNNWLTTYSEVSLEMMLDGCNSVKGTLPADKLWNNSKTFLATSAFSDCTSITNYGDIPSNWK